MATGRAISGEAVADATFETIFESTQSGGSDGGSAKGVRLTCEAGASNPAEFKVTPNFPDGGLVLQPGDSLEVVATGSGAGGITKVEAAGSGGASSVAMVVTIA